MSRQSVDQRLAELVWVCGVRRVDTGLREQAEQVSCTHRQELILRHLPFCLAGLLKRGLLLLRTGLDLIDELALRRLGALLLLLWLRARSRLDRAVSIIRLFYPCLHVLLEQFLLKVLLASGVLVRGLLVGVLTGQRVGHPVSVVLASVNLKDPSLDGVFL